jgi:hypothetical protein
VETEAHTSGCLKFGLKGGAAAKKAAGVYQDIAKLIRGWTVTLFFADFLKKHL